MDQHLGSYTFETVNDALQRQAEDSPNRIAFTFLTYRSGDEPDEANLTYAQLWSRAVSTAAHLQRVARQHDRVLILCPPGLEYTAAFFGCQQAGMVPVPAYPPRNSKHLGRLEAIVADARAAAILAPGSILAKITDWAGGADRLPPLVDIDAIDPARASAWRPPRVDPGDLAFLQYTSGTTGEPKGVMVPHAAALENAAAIIRLFGLDRDSVGVAWLPPYHDMGLVGWLLVPLVVGGRSVSMAPAAFLQRPARWLKALSDYRGSIAAAPNFGWQLCVDGVADEALAGLDLSPLRSALSGAEPVKAETLAAFCQRYARHGFRPEAFAPVYGMAETVLLATGTVRSVAPRVLELEAKALAEGRARPVSPGGGKPAGTVAPARPVVSCGRVIDGHDLRIVDAQALTALPDGMVGEIWLSGPTVAAGYWGRANLTEATFGARLAGDRPDRRWLRTGDLGAMVDGELCVLGRIKEMVIIRGANWYVQDLEGTVATVHPGLKPDRVAIFGVHLDADGTPVPAEAPGAGEEALVVVQELDRSGLRTIDPIAACAAIRRAVVTEHGVEPHAVVLIRPATLPRTTSGKVQRLAARDLFLAGTLDEVARSGAPAGADGAATPPPPPLSDAAAIARWLWALVAGAAGIADEAVPIDAPLSELGLDSLKVVELAGRIEEALGITLEASELYAYPTLADLGRRLAGGHPGDPLATPAFLAPRTVLPDDPVAVVGLACRFPGAASPEAFWELLAGGRLAVGERPASRRSADPGARREGEANGWTRGGYLRDIDRFDAAFFRIAPVEARLMDPQQRLVLETAWEALEEGALAADTLRGSRTGVFLGLSTHDYAHLVDCAGEPERAGGVSAGLYRGTGVANSVAAGRLAYLLGLEGPAVVIDTACSSSLVALHEACRALEAGEIDRAICGGVNAVLLGDLTRAFGEAGMLSPDGLCKTFDAAADGYVRGEGCGVVVLERLSDARRGGRRIRALVRGSAVNQDGASAGLTVPNGPAQSRVIAAALARAGLEPAQVDYLEAHGTGTELGDPIELRAAAAAYGPGRSSGQRLLVGSVKTNIGHLEAAAGIAGLIKTVLALDHGVVPPHINMTTPTPRVDWAELPLAVTAEPTPLPTPAETGRPARAGVSSFGFSGTNAHVILEAYGAPADHAAERVPAGSAIAGPTVMAGRAIPETAGPVVDGAPSTLGARGHRILALSGKSVRAVRDLARRYRDALPRLCEGADGARQAARLADAAFTAAVGRTHLETRAALVFANGDDLLAQLTALARTDGDAVAALAAPSIAAGARASGKGPPRIAFLFAGQGAQRAGMGRELYETEPAFHRVLDRCEAIVAAERGQSLLAVMFGDADDGRSLDDTAWAQPALFALEAGLLALWRSVGVVPDVVLGHSAGELAAAHAAGVFDLEDGLRFALRRGALMGKVSAGGTAGAMIAVFAGPVTLAETLEEMNAATDGPGLSIAADNGTHQVASGPAGLVTALEERLLARAIRVERLATSEAFHSALMDPVLAPLGRAAEALALSPPAIDLIANETGEALPAGQVPGAAHWQGHARAPVQFARSIETLAGMGIDLAVEVGPGATLSSMARLAWPGADPAGNGSSPVPPIVATLGRPRPATAAEGAKDGAAFAGAVARAYAAGVRIDFTGLFAGERRLRIGLPTYPFERQRHWVEAGRRNRGDAPLPGTRVTTARGEEILDARIDAGGPLGLSDHVVFGHVVAPAALLALLAAAARGAEGTGPAVAVERAEFLAPLVLGNGGAAGGVEDRKVQVIAVPEEGGTWAAEIFGRSAADGGWTRHARAMVRTLSAAPSDAAAPPHADGRAAGLAPLDPETLYDGFERSGLAYGPAFRGLRKVWCDRGEAVGEIALPPGTTAGGLTAHPALLDACFQLTSAAARDLLAAGEPSVAYLPVGWDRLWLSDPVPAEVRAHVRLRQPDGGDETAPEGLAADIDIRDTDGRAVGGVAGFTVKRVTASAFAALVERLDDLFYEVVWRDRPRPGGADGTTRTMPAEARAVWVVCAGPGPLSSAIARALAAAWRQVIVVRSPSETDAADADGADGAGIATARIDVADRSAWRGLLSALPSGGRLEGVVHLPAAGEADHGADAETLALAVARATGSALALAQGLLDATVAPDCGLFLLTRGAQVIAGERATGLAGAPLWGLGKVLALEAPDLSPKMIDLDPDRTGLPDGFADELVSPDGETHLAYRTGQRLAARLVHRRQAPARLALPAKPGWRLERGAVRGLDRLHAAPVAPRAPGPGEVRVAVEAAGLNFRDVLLALHLYPEADTTLGGEMCGRVLAVGPGVDAVGVGDRVVGFAAGAFAAETVTRADLVVPAPPLVPSTALAGMPIVFVTARLAFEWAGLKRGERVLIHAGAGGVGQAAIQLARAAGAEIYATASKAKHADLAALGVTRVFDSRTTAFGEQIRAATDGGGVDVVLNSLTGPGYIEASLSCLSRSGRFVEIGKRGIFTPEEMAAARPDVAYHVLAVDHLLAQAPGTVGKALGAVVGDLAAGRLKPPPVSAWPLCETPAAMAFMRSGRHVGKIVLTLPRTSSGPVRADRSYLVTGGLGGIGLMVAQWLAREGAGAVVLAGRRDPDEKALAAIEAMRAGGARVTVARVDVTDPAAIDRLLATVDADLPKLGGIVHSVGVLSDAAVPNQDWVRFDRVLAPKVLGAWHLHRATCGRDLDLFVMMSSTAGVIGNPGQSNHAAANAFLDQLARHRRSLGLPGQSFAWGAWAGSGEAEERRGRIGARLAAAGVGWIAPERGIEAFDRLVRLGATTGTIVPVDWAALARQLPGPAPFLEEVLPRRAAAEPGPDGPCDREALADALAAADPEGRARILVGLVTRELQSVLDLAAPPDPLVGFFDLGLDSLMAVELTNRLNRTLGTDVSPRALFDAPTPADLARLFDRAPAHMDAIPASDRSRPAVLSTAQRRCLAIETMTPGSGVLNLGGIMILRGPLDVGKLEQACRTVVERHEVLRTRYAPAADGTGFESILDDGATFRLVRRTVVPGEGETPHAVARQEARRTIDPFAEPVFQAVLVTAAGSDQAAGDHEAMLTLRVHHVAFDAVSFAVFQRELVAAYGALLDGRPVALPARKLQYRDFAAFEATRLGTAGREALVAYWREQLAGAPARVDLPFDRPRPARLSDRVGQIVHRIAGPDHERITRLAARHEVTPFVVLETALALVCARLAASDDMVIGTVTEGRYHPDLTDMIGLFVNTVPLRHRIDGSAPAAALLRAARDTLLGAIEHDGLPFADIVAALEPPRSGSHDPVFQVFCQLRQGGREIEDGLGPAAVALEPLVSEGRGGDLTMVFDRDGDGVVAVVSYAADLFERDTAEGIVALYRAMLDALLADPEATVDRSWQRAAGAFRETGAPAVVRRLLDAPPEATGAWYPLSAAQQDLWLAEQLAPGGSSFDALAAMTVPASVDLARLEAAVRGVIAQTQSLHLAIGPDGLQSSRPAPTTTVTRFDHTQAGAPADPDDPVMAWHRGRAGEGGTAFALFAFSEGVTVAVSGDHLFNDGWAGLQMLERVCANDRALERNADETFSMDRRFLPLLRDDQLYRWSDACAADRAHWRERAATLDGRPLVDGLADRAPTGAQRSRSVRATVDPSLFRAVEAAGNGLSLSLAETWTGLVALYFARLVGRDSATFVVPHLNRDRQSLKIPGQFAGFVPVGVALAEDATVADVLRAVAADFRAATGHGRVPFGEIMRIAGLDRHVANVSINTLFLRRSPSIGGAPATMRWLAGPESGLSILLTRFGGAAPAEIELRYNEEVFDRTMVDRHLERLTGFLRRALEDPAAPARALQVMGKAERALVLHGFNDTAVQIPRDRTVVDLFCAQARERPDAVAVVDGERTLTYGELDRASNRLARHLIGRGVGPEIVVGVCLERSASLIVALLALWKAGGAYLPLDPEYPEERLAFMLEDAGAKLVVTAGAAAETLPASGEVVKLDAPGIVAALSRTADGAVPPGERTGPLIPDTLAYVIFTSGSTGRPKGVAVDHRALTNYASFAETAFAGGGKEIVLHRTTLGFDYSAEEIWWTLCHGHRLVVARRDATQDPATLLELIDEEGVTTMVVVPALLAALVASDRFARARRLRQILCGGEALPPSLAAAVMAARSGIRLVNHYGPSEATINATMAVVEEEFAAANAGSVPIGGPISNTTAYVVDRDLEPVAVGIRGELLIGGVQLARGYVGRPELTADRFIPDPFGAVPGARLYRTGDLARWRPDGTLEFLGRIDQQVKIRGMRVEPGEVEAALTACEGVREAVVTAHADGSGDARLFAYLVPEAGDAGGAQAAIAPAKAAAPRNDTPRPVPLEGILDGEALRANLARRLPGYMVPAGFMGLDRLPLTASGKVDRNHLPEATPAVARGSEAAPETVLEQRVAAAFEEVLGVERVGRHDDFFALGGHSLMAMRLVARLEAETGRRLPVRALFEATTVAQTAAAIAAAEAGAYRPLTAFAAPGARADDAPAGPALVCVHPFSGLSAPYRQLVAPLAGKARVLGIAARGLETGESVFESYAEMIDTYHAAIRDSGETGDMVLLGWSYGASVAVDLAARLSAEGRGPGGLVLLDGQPWNAAFGQGAAPFLEAADRPFEDWRDRLLAAIGAPPSPSTPSAARSAALVAAAAAGGFVDPVAGHGDPADLDRSVRVWHALCAIAAEKPEIGRFEGRALIVRAADTREVVADPALGWSTHCGAIRPVDVPFGHFELMRPEAAAHLAGLITGWLASSARPADGPARGAPS